MRPFILIIFIGLVTVTLSALTLETSLLKSLKSGKQANIIISFKNANVQNVRTNALAKARGGPRAAVIQSMYDALTAHARSTQEQVLNMLEKHRSTGQMKVQSLWITNQVGIKGADMSVVSSLLTLDEISEITEDIVVGLISPVTATDLPENYFHVGEQWGIINIEAPSVWEDGIRGEGVVVGSLDTGVMATHEALRDAYRAENGWFDPAEFDSTPTDRNGHGTHTVGTMVGRTNGIGVAPAAKFIACKGMDYTGSGLSADFIACGQFMLCPTEADGKTNPRCDLAPIAVGNSWGIYRSGFGFFDQVIKSWIDAGIAPIFAAGNDGTSCETVRTPGNAPDALTIGATDKNNSVTDFSSAGPTVNNTIKPTVSAPGLDTISAGITSNTSYAIMSGTSMATPHVVGLTALLHHKRSGLNYAELHRVLVSSAQPTVPLGESCGGISDTTYPNNHVGHGRISARAAVDAISKILN